MKPNSEEVSGMKHGLYSKLDDSGSLPEECIVEYGDILIGKVTPIQQIGMSNKNTRTTAQFIKTWILVVLTKFGKTFTT